MTPVYSDDGDGDDDREQLRVFCEGGGGLDLDMQWMDGMDGWVGHEALEYSQ